MQATAFPLRYSVALADVCKNAPGFFRQALMIINWQDFPNFFLVDGAQVIEVIIGLQIQPIQKTGSLVAVEVWLKCSIPVEFPCKTLDLECTPGGRLWFDVPRSLGCLPIAPLQTTPT
jgi:hypothetical protein